MRAESSPKVKIGECLAMIVHKLRSTAMSGDIICWPTDPKPSIVSSYGRSLLKRTIRSS